MAINEPIQQKQYFDYRIIGPSNCKTYNQYIKALVTEAVKKYNHVEELPTFRYKCIKQNSTRYFFYCKLQKANTKKDY